MMNLVPSIGWLREYRRPWLRLDVVAGLTAAAVVVPRAMACAAIAGLPVQVGLYAALVPMVIYALLGTSRQLSVSTTSTIAILVAAELALVTPTGTPGQRIAAADTLAMLVGGFLLLAGMLRLGRLANFVSDPVLTGFKAGIGLVVIADQLPKLLGVHIAKAGFFRDLWAVAQHAPDASVSTAVLALAMLTLLFGMQHFLPRVPAPLVAVALGIGASSVLNLGRSGVALVGNIPSGLPSPAWPGVSLVGELWPGALGIALMAFTESIAAGRAFARHGDRRPDADSELRALGLANLAGGLFQAMPAGGGTSQTAVNAKAGARTQLAELVTAAMVVAVLLFLAPLVGLMPLATLAAVVVATTAGLLSPKGFLAILRFRRTEFLWALAACVGVVLLGTLQGILVAIAISVLTLIWQANHPPIYALGRKPGTNVFRPLSPEHPEDETFPGLLLIRAEGRMNFASAPNMAERGWGLIHEARPRVLVLDFAAIPDIEYTALGMLTGFEEKLRESGAILWLSALNPEPLRVIRRSPLGGILGPGRLFHTLEEAVNAFLATPSGPESRELKGSNT